VLVLVLVLDLQRVAEPHVVLTDPADFVTMCSGPGIPNFEHEDEHEKSELVPIGSDSLILL
jgi:hypothetical protein